MRAGLAFGGQFFGQMASNRHGAAAAFGSRQNSSIQWNGIPQPCRPNPTPPCPRTTRQLLILRECLENHQCPGTNDLLRACLPARIATYRPRHFPAGTCPKTKGSGTVRGNCKSPAADVRDSWSARPGGNRRPVDNKNALLGAAGGSKLALLSGNSARKSPSAESLGAACPAPVHPGSAK